MLIINHVINGCSTTAYDLEKTLFAIMRQIFPAKENQKFFFLWSVDFLQYPTAYPMWGPTWGTQAFPTNPLYF